MDVRMDKLRWCAASVALLLPPLLFAEGARSGFRATQVSATPDRQAGLAAFARLEKKSIESKESLRKYS